MQTLGLSVEVCTFSWEKMTLLGKREMEVLQEPCVGYHPGKPRKGHWPGLLIDKSCFRPDVVPGSGNQAPNEAGVL